MHIEKDEYFSIKSHVQSCTTNVFQSLDVKLHFKRLIFFTIFLQLFINWHILQIIGVCIYDSFWNFKMLKYTSNVLIAFSNIPQFLHAFMDPVSSKIFSSEGRFKRLLLSMLWCQRCNLYLKECKLSRAFNMIISFSWRGKLVLFIYEWRCQLNKPTFGLIPVTILA